MQVRDARAHAFGLIRFPSQNGQVRHCSGLASYTVQIRFGCTTLSSPGEAANSFMNTQSYPPWRGFLISFSASLPPTCRQYVSINSSRDIPRISIILAISRCLTHTYPGAPLQQFPHCLHVNRSPSANHGAAGSPDSKTFSFMIGLEYTG